jgi:hypothetical protein
MAGAFGYAKDTIEVSRAMGELSLLPAVRAASGETLIVADGTSCRHQIKDNTARTAVHVARVLARSAAAARQVAQNAMPPPPNTQLTESGLSRSTAKGKA